MTKSRNRTKSVEPELVVEPKLDAFQRVDLEADQKKAEEERLARLDGLAQSLAGKRRSAIDARAQSGIEQIWLEDEDAFDGIDDLNRNTEGAQGTRHRYTKSKSISGTYTRTDTESSASVCTLLPNITGQYVEASAATIADILLPLDDWPFGLGTTPIPELTGLLEAVKDMPSEQMVAAPGMSQPLPAGQIKANGEAEIERAKKAAEKAETRIKDWLTECQWHGKSRQQIDDSARVGTGIVKGPVPKVKKQYVWHDQDGVQILEIREETKPITENVYYWNLFPDYPACGQSIHNGSFVWERGEYTKKTIEDLRGQEGYINSQIDLCLREGPLPFEVEGSNYRQKSTGKDGPFEIWWFHGNLDREDAEAAGCDCGHEDDTYISVPAVITVVNGRIIRGALNHLDKGSFPYDVLTWRKRAGMPWGQGVGRQIRPSQQAITGAFRTLMENAGLSAKPMLAVLRKYLHPTDGTWELFGGKVFEVDDDADVREVKNAITTIQIESRQAELLAIIQFNLQLAEYITGQSILQQGQTSRGRDTATEASIANANAGVVKRRVARQFDDQVIEPGITRYYDYLMQYGKDESEKGLYIIDARASSVLVERDIQNKGMIQLLGASRDSSYGADPRKVYAETAKAMKIDPARLQYSDEEWKRIQENASRQPADPRIQTAQIRAEADARIEASRQEFEARENDLERRNKIAVEMIDEKMQTVELTSLEAQVLAKIKAELAKTVMTLRTQKELAAADAAVKQVATPAVEPRGRAPSGQAFQK